MFSLNEKYKIELHSTWRRDSEKGEQEINTQMLLRPYAGLPRPAAESETNYPKDREQILDAFVVIEWKITERRKKHERNLDFTWIKLGSRMMVDRGTGGFFSASKPVIPVRELRRLHKSLSQPTRKQFPVQFRNCSRISTWKFVVAGVKHRQFAPSILTHFRRALSRRTRAMFFPKKNFAFSPRAWKRSGTGGNFSSSTSPYAASKLA